MPTEVIELIASQLILGFKDVIAFSSTSRRVHEATAFLITKPILVEDIRDIDDLSSRVNMHIGLSRCASATGWIGLNYTNGHPEL
jgi:hypothetical protein